MEIVTTDLVHVTWFTKSRSATYLAPSARNSLWYRSRCVRVWINRVIWWQKARGDRFISLDSPWAHQPSVSFLRGPGRFLIVGECPVSECIDESGDMTPVKTTSRTRLSFSASATYFAPSGPSLFHDRSRVLSVWTYRWNRWHVTKGSYLDLTRFTFNASAKYFPPSAFRRLLDRLNVVMV